MLALGLRRAHLCFFGGTGGTFLRFFEAFVSLSNDSSNVTHLKSLCQ